MALRNEAEAFDADSEARRVMTHESDSVMAFARKKGDQENLVVSSFNKTDLSGYRLPVQGKWEPFSADPTCQYSTRTVFEGGQAGASSLMAL